MAFLFQNTPKTAQNITIKKKNGQSATAKSATSVTMISATYFLPLLHQSKYCRNRMIYDLIPFFCFNIVIFKLLNNQSEHVHFQNIRTGFPKNSIG